MEQSYKKRARREMVMEYVFLAAACMSILCVALICVFLFANGLPAMGEIGVFKFLSGKRWKPSADIYGIFPMILGSIYVTAGALLMGVPVAHSVGRLRLLRHCGAGADGACAERTVGRKRQLDAHGVHPAGNHDSADHHRRG